MMRAALRSTFVLGVFISGPALAHIRLNTPLARYPAPDEDVKARPCGRANDSRTTDAARITTFRPGETITVKWKETINHTGYYRIAFDNDGQDDFKDPTNIKQGETNPQLPVLLDDIKDKAGQSDYEVTVKLPDVECTKCTLQLIQVMSDSPSKPFYYQCADLILKREGGGGSGGGGSGSGGASGSGGSSGASGDSGKGGSAGSGGNSGQGGQQTPGGTTSGSGGTGGSNPGTTGGSGGNTTGGNTTGGLAGASTGSGGTSGAGRPGSGGSPGTGGSGPGGTEGGSCSFYIPASSSRGDFGLSLLALSIVGTALERRRRGRTGPSVLSNK